MRSVSKILFNIYASSEHQIYVNEMQEIDEFFDQLDPDIEVIWGTSTDDSLGEDAKVTILATGIENEFSENMDVVKPNDSDEHFENLMKELYKPIQKTKPKKEEEKAVTEEENVGNVSKEPPFVVVAPAPEPLAVNPVNEDNGRKPSILSRWKAWLKENMEMYEE